MQQVLKVFLGLLLCVSSIAAQALGVTDTKFNPQGWAVNGYQEYEFVSCNQANAVLTVDTGQVKNAARQFGISLVSYSRVEKTEEKKPSWVGWKWAGRFGQVLSVTFVLADQAGAWKIGNNEQPARWKLAIPAVGLVLPQVVSWVRENKPQTELASSGERLPENGVFEIPAKRCKTYIVYGVSIP